MCAVILAAVTACNSKGGKDVNIYPVDGGLAMRVQPISGDTLSLLGYGCMRWPMIDAPDGSGKIVDQEKVNELVDYAIAHGVNYFDVSPAYLGGKAEPATGIALSRYPRSSYYIADKMSNHHLLKSGIKGDSLYNASVAMYKRSMEYLKTDTFDYYLLHNVGYENRGLSFLKERLFDNHLIDFILEERKAGRIRNLGFSFHGESREVFDFLMGLHDRGEITWDFVQLKFNYVDFPEAVGVEMSAGEMYRELESRGIPVIVMEPIRGGALASLPDSLAAGLKERNPDMSLASWGFRYVASYPGVMTVLSGMTEMDHLKDNISTYSPLKPLTEEEAAMLENIGGELYPQTAEE